ncbi:MAG: RluA family pseudouridine synthase, partial [Oscillospiraceae bacterium]|nr:RluA family pseudouridine synthase [Oscillospiraceae bacterium]
MKDSLFQTGFKVPDEWDRKTCGDFLRYSGVSKRLTAKLKRVPDGIVLNGSHVRTVDIVYAGDVVSIKNIDDSLLEPNGGLTVPVVYENEDVIVFDKPAGMPVHPSHKHRDDTLGNCFAAMFEGLTFRPINRLDKDTSGLCAIAKTAYAANALAGNISKVYAAVTEGVPIPKSVENPLIKWYETAEGYRIEAPIGRADGTVINREVREDGQSAVTNYTIKKESGGFALLRISLETGRTHQIRVHFSSLGYPLAGDDLYGGSLDRCKRQALH